MKKKPNLSETILKRSPNKVAKSGWYDFKTTRKIDSYNVHFSEWFQPLL